MNLKKIVPFIFIILITIGIFYYSNYKKEEVAIREQAEVKISKDNTITTVFEFNKPFSITGIPLTGSNFAPLYTSDKILEDSLVTIRAESFFSDACERGRYRADCELKNEQMVGLGVAVTGYNKMIYLTEKSIKTREYEGYNIEIISIDSKNKQATIIISNIK